MIEMSAQKAYLNMIKELHTMNAIQLCLASYDARMSSAEIIHGIYQLEVTEEEYPSILIWSPFEKYTSNQIVHYITQIAETSMKITMDAVENKPSNYVVELALGLMEM